MGYFQLALAEERSMLTTFLTLYGKYKYNRSPMGCICRILGFGRRNKATHVKSKGVGRVSYDNRCYKPTGIHRIGKPAGSIHTIPQPVPNEDEVIAAKEVTFF